MAGNMGLLNPFVLNQFSATGNYSPYAQFAPINTGLMSQHAALVAASAQGAYISPVTGLPISPQGINGLTSPAVVTTASEGLSQPPLALTSEFIINTARGT